jgi:3-phenylpropionate/trans-cinnamate dioxygenase ferredoxin subunit
VTVAKASEIPEGEARRFTVDGQAIAVANLGEGEFRALGAICSHAQAFLDEGEVDPDLETIECPRHGSTFDLETGKPKSLPATTPVPAFRVKVEDNDVKVEIDE